MQEQNAGAKRLILRRRCVAVSNPACYHFRMRHFYGYQRQPKDAPAGVDHVWLDYPETHRQARVDLIEMGVRAGDTVEVVQIGDLGHGREATAMRAAIEAKGATVSIIPGPPPAPRGRPAIFDPAPEVDRKIERLYRSPAVLSHVIEKASEWMGWPVKRHHLVRRYGRRWNR